MKKNKFIIILFCLTLIPQTAFAYLGPGLALGTIVLTITIVIVLLLAIMAVLYYPVKKMIKNIKLKKLKK